MKLPKDCKNIKDVRTAIDLLDEQIIELLGQRFKYVKEIVKFKDKDPDSIIAKDRKQAVINSRREWALKNGLNPDLIEEIYLILINYFINEELKIANKKRIN